jgi:FdhE protein
MRAALRRNILLRVLLAPVLVVSFLSTTGFLVSIGAMVPMRAPQVRYQPYARWLAESGSRPVDRSFDSRENRCPFCGGMPQVSFLQITEASSESGNRHLICALCLTNWSFRRVVCAYCGEERPFKLGYFHTQEYDHVRIEACDNCKHYIKGVDLTRFGLAIPLVDEIASAALDVWAQAHGYSKIELNMVGL